MWKQIYDLDYEINEQSVVRRISSRRVKKSFKRKDGYIGIQLYINKTKSKNYLLHILKALAFIPKPLGKDFVNHKDSIRDNNDLSNLEWCTKQYNVVHGYTSGYATNKGSSNGFSKLTETLVLEIRKRKEEEGLTCQQLATLYNVSYGCISGVIQRSNWKHI